MPYIVIQMWLKVVPLLEESVIIDMLGTKHDILKGVYCMKINCLSKRSIMVSVMTFLLVLNLQDPLRAEVEEVITVSNKVNLTKSELSGLLTWNVESEQFSMQLIQLSSDYIRAVYSKYDFPKSEIERVASYCNFGTIIRNTSGQSLSYRVADWRYIDSDGKAHPVKTKTQWLQEWKAQGITYSWSLLADSGDYEAGDWQQGFTTINIPKDEKFDFIYDWVMNGKRFQQTIKDMSCAL